MSKPSVSHAYGRWLTAMLGLVLLMHWLFVYLDLYASSVPLTRLTPLFDLDRERNLPTLISSGLFLLVSYWCIRLAVISRYKSQKLGWIMFAGLLGYFALDEFLIIHEQLAEPVRKLLNISTTSPLFHAWVIPGIVAAGLLGATLLFIRQHKQKLTVFTPMLVRVFILVAGTITWEIAGTYVYGHQTTYRLLMVPIEEMFELTMTALIGLQAYRIYRTLSTKKQKILQP
ncbi:MAG TPA: hypothetical protein VK694_06130 [Verrucomicrobiae bacterium]|nr:hypothetical protein [Verrucomicrobiae bacterium]